MVGALTVVDFIKEVPLLPKNGYTIDMFLLKVALSAVIILIILIIIHMTTPKDTSIEKMDVGSNDSDD